MTPRFCTNEFQPTFRAFSTNFMHRKAAMISNPSVKRFGNQVHKSESVRPELHVFKIINQLTRQGKWNSLEHKPKPFLFGEEAKYIYGVYYEKFFDVKYRRWSERWALGKEIEAISRVVLFFVGLQVIIVLYNTFLPETYRFKYKYEIKQKLEAHHKSDDNHH